MAFNTIRKPALRIQRNPHPAPREPVARRDWSSQMGAHEQAQLIREYWWREKGIAVTITVVHTGHHASDGLFGLKSNMIGGLPPQ